MKRRVITKSGAGIINSHNTAHDGQNSVLLAPQAAATASLSSDLMTPAVLGTAGSFSTSSMSSNACSPFPLKSLLNAGNKNMLNGSVGAASKTVKTPLPLVFNNLKLRCGKWLPEEEEYADALIKLFEHGYVRDCENGVTLRAYLSFKLHCAPMRISKKYAGTGKGKLVFLQKLPSVTMSDMTVLNGMQTISKGVQFSASRIQSMQDIVDQLEKRFHKTLFVADELTQDSQGSAATLKQSNQAGVNGVQSMALAEQYSAAVFSGYNWQQFFPAPAQQNVWPQPQQNSATMTDSVDCSFKNASACGKSGNSVKTPVPELSSSEVYSNCNSNLMGNQQLQLDRNCNVNYSTPEMQATLEGQSSSMMQPSKAFSAHSVSTQSPLMSETGLTPYALVHTSQDIPSLSNGGVKGHTTNVTISGSNQNIQQTVPAQCPSSTSAVPASQQMNKVSNEHEYYAPITTDPKTNETQKIPGEIISQLDTNLASQAEPDHVRKLLQTSIDTSSVQHTNTMPSFSHHTVQMSNTLVSTAKSDTMPLFSAESYALIAQQSARAASPNTADLPSMYLQSPEKIDKTVLCDVASVVQFLSDHVVEKKIAESVVSFQPMSQSSDRMHQCTSLLPAKKHGSYQHEYTIHTTPTALSTSTERGETDVIGIGIPQRGCFGGSTMNSSDYNSIYNTNTNAVSASEPASSSSTTSESGLGSHRSSRSNGSSLQCSDKINKKYNDNVYGKDDGEIVYAGTNTSDESSMYSSDSDNCIYNDCDNKSKEMDLVPHRKKRRSLCTTSPKSMDNVR